MRRAAQLVAVKSHVHAGLLTDRDEAGRGVVRELRVGTARVRHAKRAVPALAQLVERQHAGTDRAPTHVVHTLRKNSFPSGPLPHSIPGFGRI